MLFNLKWILIRNKMSATNRRSKQIVNLILNSEKTEEQNVSDNLKNREESPLRRLITDEEWKTLNEMYDCEDEELSAIEPPDRSVIFEEPMLEENINLLNGGENLDYFVNNSDDDFVLDSAEVTPMPSPGSMHDFAAPHMENQIPINIQSVCSLVTDSDVDPLSPAVPKGRKKTFKTDPGRKRKRHPEQWIQTQRKVLKNAGKQYTSKKGKTMPAKSLKAPCPPTCKLKCSLKLTEDNRRTIFNQFWKLDSSSQKWEYINKFTNKVKKNRKTTEGQSRRQFTTKYFLPLPNDVSYEPTPVCLKMFCSTLSVTDQQIRTANEKLDSNGITAPDNRGKHSNHLRKVDEEMVRSVCDHVRSFQAVESHYTRKDSSKLYLDNSLSFTKMFSLYKDWPNLQQYSNTAETERQYRCIVNDSMNIAFFVPKKDQCDKCTAFTNTDSPTEVEIATHNLHIQNKETARKLKTKDKTEAIESSSKVVCATYDFQKLLNCPHGELGLFYYKRKLSIMHFTVFDAGIKEASCYVWPENIAKRGANEVGSCLLDFIQKKVTEGAKDFRFWSDNCSGQNRNRVIYSLYMYASNIHSIDITHRFLEAGHTQQEADSVHALIERSAKGKTIYTPDQWYALIRWAKTDDRPYNVNEVTQDMILDLKELLPNRNWKKNTCNQQMKWNNIKEIHIKHTDPNMIYYKYNFEDDYMTINTLVRTRRNKKSTTVGTIDLKPLYANELPITEAKHKDLVSLCDAKQIPKQYHSFYKNIIYVNRDESDSDSDEQDHNV